MQAQALRDLAQTTHKILGKRRLFSRLRGQTAISIYKGLPPAVDSTGEEKYRMSLFRVALLTTAAVFVLPPSHANAQPRVAPSVEAQFLGGSVKGIPAESLGMLSMKDAQELRFQYGNSVYRVPYAQIIDTEVQDPTNKGHWLVHNPLRKRFETLVISYHDANGAESTLNFLMNSRVAGSAETFISVRRNQVEEANADPASFWGDKIWKTPRTREYWDQPQQKPTTAALAAGGTK
jgi:hypothetical protein